MSSNVGLWVGKPQDPRHIQACDKVEHTYLVGVEIEVTGHRPVGSTEYLRYWTTHRDGSIRGDNAAEFVFAVPLGGVDIVSALEEWQRYIAETQVKLRVNHSCSFHVHLDVRDLTAGQLTKLIMLYLALERALYHFVGDDRHTNPFSAPLYSIDDMISELGSGPTGDWVTRTSAFGRYAGLNLAAIARYGSIEFRHHPGTLDVVEMLRWINIVGKLKDFALNDLAPEDILQVASASGYAELTARVFGKYAPLFNYSGASHDMFLGLRMAQDFLYRNNTRSASALHQQEAQAAALINEGRGVVEPASSGWDLVHPSMRKGGVSKAKKKVRRPSLEEAVRGRIGTGQVEAELLEYTPPPSGQVTNAWLDAVRTDARTATTTRYEEP